MTKTWLDNCVPRIDVLECHLRYVFVHAQSLSFVWLFVTLWTIACQALLSMGFSRQEYWSGLPCLSQGIFLTQGSNPHLLCLLHWQTGSLPLAMAGKPQWAITHSSVCFDAQLIPNLASDEPLQAGPVLCWRVPIGFGALSYFLARHIP